ncbi:MAG: PLP-dependent aminotransferase family protein [Firmicutes bacterium]|nr:PLP-dependent aminotransferase family protein [Bacillota bacterium]
MQGMGVSFSARAEGMRSSEIRELLKNGVMPGVISFAGGFPSPEYFPAGKVGEIVADLMRNNPAACLQYGETEGLAPLRSYLAEKMAREGIPAGEENILLTNGSQQALDLIGKVFIDPGDVVLVEQPGYVGGIGAFANYEACLEGIPLDGQGLRADLLGQRLAEMAAKGVRPKLLYLVPNFQNPSGTTMGLERRVEILQLAQEHDFRIVEDDPYGELYCQDAPPPSIKSLERRAGAEGRVIYLGSFSKVLIPGLRVGWMAADARIVERASLAKQPADLCSSMLGQWIVLEVCRRGLLEPHIESLRKVYRQKRDQMLDALGQWGPEDASWTRPTGGFFVWVTLAGDVDTKEMLPYALENKVTYVSGGGFHVDGTGKNTMRLSYSQPGLAEISEGIRRLAEVIAKFHFFDRAGRISA